MALYRSPLTVTFWPSSFLKKYGPMIPPAHKAHQTWCKRFSVGRESTEDDQRPGRLVTVSGVETVTKINQIVRAGRRMSIRMILEAVNADKETNKKSKDVQIEIRGNVDLFFDINGIVITEWVPEGQTVNQTYDLSVLVTLRERVCKKWPELWKNNSWILHQDKAPAHNALSVKRYLADKRTPVLEHAPYSPDLAPCDFFFFPKIKSALKGTRFESMEAVKQKTAELLKALTKEDFQHCFDLWKGV
ncbi:putative mariner transposase [Trichonephila clavipes]|uniref:Putative mariner transposase n=1 Tax=Trichonephila clavipes TaxID=2585209 RepID=A0A8X6V9D3_TRICX|nr:putative mariner transposase [Trichonephila clavipes]